MKYTCYKETSDTLLHTAKRRLSLFYDLLVSVCVCKFHGCLCQ
uniref:Uncharacterized protein n=1 Tax=Anguilla anguilla TaxID=7936 RepID=A0A0E9UFF8_ANGAN